MTERDVQFAEELSFATELAIEAGNIAMRYFGRELTVKSKSDASPVTEADETINRLVVDACRQRFPDYGVLGEENSWEPQRARKWICDPIDGTAEFIKNKPNFMFSLSLDYDGQPVVAVTLHPVSGALYYATAGGGAYMNGHPLHVADHDLTSSTLAFPTNPAILTMYHELYEKLAANSSQTVRIHSSIYKGMNIAAGTINGAIWPESVHPWDAHAVKLIVEQAGGVVSDTSGQPYERYDQDLQRGLIVSSAAIHGELVKIAQCD